MFCSKKLNLTLRVSRSLIPSRKFLNDYNFDISDMLLADPTDMSQLPDGVPDIHLVRDCELRCNPQYKYIEHVP